MTNLQVIMQAWDGAVRVFFDQTVEMVDALVSAHCNAMSIVVLDDNNKLWDLYHKGERFHW